MLKSHEFQYGVDDRRIDSLQFSEQSNTHFVYHDMNELIETRRDLLKEMVTRFFEEQKPRLEILDSYSKGQNYTTLAGRRRIEDNKSDYRVTHNWGAYISNYITGYLMSLPITIGTKEPNDDEAVVLAELNLSLIHI